MYPAGSTCTGPVPGAEVTYFEQAAKHPSRLDSGFGLTGLPDSTCNSTSLIDLATLPRGILTVLRASPDSPPMATRILAE
jgi:hypothetical protein